MIDPNNKNLFHRELSWIEFNSRVLAEAMDASNPLLERLKFAGIVSSNFDEFFMVRLASLKGNGEIEKEVRTKAFSLIKKHHHHFSETLVPELANAGIVRVSTLNLTERQMDYAKNFFQKELFPVLTPIAVVPEKPIPALLNLTLYIMVCLVESEKPESKHYAVIEIPKNFPRIISLPADKGYQFLLLEDLVALFAKELFLGYVIVEQGLMRLTRGADMTLDEEKDEDFAKIMTEAVRLRNSGEILRVEISAPKGIETFFKHQLGIKDELLCPVDTWFDLRGISQLAFQSGFDELKRPAWTPKPVIDFENTENIWDLLKTKDLWINHPYDSFDPVNRFIAAAADDPDVLAIKQTLYRAGSDSKLIHSLARAAEKGKRVTVLVELKARFDEEKNIEWAHRLEVAGASVLYGVVGFKTHAKACMVVRREPEGIKRYVHLSTGNYNEKTAAIYSDIGLFTIQEDIVNDISAFFNMITGFSHPGSFSKIDVAPFGLRRRLKRLITREMMQSTKADPGLIILKMNSLVDPELIESLYEASKAGVQIKLNVRGICCLRPGVKGLSENIEVVSIVDMFLEHSRIFYFKNAGDEELYLSSADWMPRNLDRRIEILFPIESKDIRAELADILKRYFKDNVKSWKLASNGEYSKIEHGQEKKFRIQEYLCRKASEREEQLRTIAPSEMKPQKPNRQISGNS